eukprot:6847020-Alexandrium_andersonii.AAC.1
MRAQLVLSGPISAFQSRSACCPGNRGAFRKDHARASWTLRPGPCARAGVRRQGVQSRGGGPRPAVPRHTSCN